TVLVRGRISEDDPDKRLLPWDEAVQGATQALAATALNRLHDELKNLAIKTDGSTEDGVKADFLGVRGIGSVATTFHLEINPEGLLKGVGTEEPVFRASGEAVFKGGFSSPFASGTVDATVRLEVELTRQDVLYFLPRMDVPELPHFGLVMPKVELAKWSLADLKFPKLKLDFFRLPLQEDLNIQVTWTPQNPDLEFAIVNDKLTMKTTEAHVSVNFDSMEILTADKVALTVDGTQ